MRVTVELIDPAADEHLWAEKYSGKLEDIFEIQEQISRRIVDALKMRLSPEEDKKLAERPIDNVEAFECYQRARHEIYQFTPDGIDRALDLVQTALAIVGDNELLYATMGTVYWQYVNAAIKDDGYIEKAQECVRKIFALNAESAPGYALQGAIHQNQGRAAEAVRSYKNALEIDPKNLYAKTELARVYECSGSLDEGHALYASALEADPFSLITRGGIISTGLLRGEFDMVVDQGGRFIEHVPQFPPLRWVIAIALIHSGRIADAQDVLSETPPERVPTIGGQSCRFTLAALEGRPDAARASFDPDLLSRARSVEFWSWWVSECYALIGDRDSAVDWLENAFQRGFFCYPYVANISTIYRKLIGDPAFDRVLSEMKTAWETFEP